MKPEGPALPLVLLVLTVLLAETRFQGDARSGDAVHTIIVEASPASRCGVRLVQARRVGDPPASYRQRLLVGSDCDCDLRPDGVDPLFDPAENAEAFAGGIAACRALLAAQD